MSVAAESTRDERRWWSVYTRADLESLALNSDLFCGYSLLNLCYGKSVHC